MHRRNLPCSSTDSLARTPSLLLPAPYTHWKTSEPACSAALDSRRAFPHDWRSYSGRDERMLVIINPIVIGGVAAVAIFFGVLVFLVLGRGIGQRAIVRGGGPPPNIGSLEAAVFALLGL